MGVALKLRLRLNCFISASASSCMYIFNSIKLTVKICILFQKHGKGHKTARKVWMPRCMYLFLFIGNSSITHTWSMLVWVPFTPFGAYLVQFFRFGESQLTHCGTGFCCCFFFFLFWMALQDQVRKILHFTCPLPPKQSYTVEC